MYLELKLLRRMRLDNRCVKCSLKQKCGVLLFFPRKICVLFSIGMFSNICRCWGLRGITEGRWLSQRFQYVRSDDERKRVLVSLYKVYFDDWNIVPVR